MSTPTKNEILYYLRGDITCLKDSNKEADGKIRDPEILREIDCHQAAIKIVKKSKGVR